MNNVELIGRLTKDPVTRYTTGATPTAVTRFTLAVNDGYGEDKKANFIPIVVFGKQAENVEKFLAKGSQAAITGRIQTGSYEKEGRTIYTTDVVANRVEFLGGKNNSATAEEIPADEPPRGFESMDDDIPF